MRLKGRCVGVGFVERLPDGKTRVSGWSFELPPWKRLLGRLPGVDAVALEVSRRNVWVAGHTVEDLERLAG